MTEPLTFLRAARLLREKGIVEYVEAARRVKARHPHARFVLLGGSTTIPARSPKGRCAVGCRKERSSGQVT